MLNVVGYQVVQANHGAPRDNLRVPDHVAYTRTMHANNVMTT